MHVIDNIDYINNIDVIDNIKYIDKIDLPLDMDVIDVLN